MSEWKEYKLGEITTKIGDGLHGTPMYDDNGDYCFVNGNNLSKGKVLIKPDTKRVNESEFFKYRKPLSDKTILLGINGTYGNLAFYNGEKCILGKSACYINVSDDVDKYFLYYNFLNSDFQLFLDSIATGTTIPNVPLKGLREYSILLPPLPEQKAIAAVLSSLDDKIDLLHRQNKTLEAMAETLFRQWFVEEADEGWETVKLGDLGKVITGKTPSTKNPEYWGDQYPFVTPTDFKDFGMFANVVQRGISDLGWQNLVSLQVPKNAILVTCIGSDMGKVAISTQPCITNQQLNTLIVRDDKYLGYTFCYIRSQYQLIRSIALGGTTMPIINKTDFSNIEIPYPPTNIVKLFQKKWCALSSKILKNNIQIRTLEKLRDTLLPKLMSGEVRVSQ